MHRTHSRRWILLPIRSLRALLLSQRTARNHLQTQQLNNNNSIHRDPSSFLRAYWTQRAHQVNSNRSIGLRLFVQGAAILQTRLAICSLTNWIRRHRVVLRQIARIQVSANLFLSHRIITYRHMLKQPNLSKDSKSHPILLSAAAS